MNELGGLGQVIFLQKATPALHLHCSQVFECQVSPSANVSPLYGHLLDSLAGVNDIAI